jgi:hypothetical protein
MHRAIACLAVSLVGLSGCFLFGQAGSDPCAEDRFGCLDTDLQEHATCEADDDLIVHVGAGEGSYQALEPGEPPSIVYGAQGGQHTTLGVEVENAELDRYDRLRVEIGIYPASMCPVAGDPCEGEPTLGRRSVVLGDFEPLRVTEDGVVQEFGIVVFLGGTEEPEGVIQLEVEDPCGRRGLEHHRMPTDTIGGVR